MWKAEWGDKTEFLEDLEDSGMSPKALENKPEIHTWMIEYIDAFEVLNQTRSYGMAPNPISLTEILAYLQLYGSSDAASFVKYILAMDEAFLSATSKRLEREKANGSRPGT